MIFLSDFLVRLGWVFGCFWIFIHVFSLFQVARRQYVSKEIRLSLDQEHRLENFIRIFYFNEMSNGYHNNIYTKVIQCLQIVYVACD